MASKKPQDPPRAPSPPPAAPLDSRENLTTKTPPADSPGNAPAGQSAAHSQQAPTPPQVPEQIHPDAEPTIVASAAERVPDKDIFPDLDTREERATFDIDAVESIPVDMTVELGRCRMSIRELLQLGQGSVVELDNVAGTPMDVYVNGLLIAQGEVVVVNESYGIRLTDIMTAADRLARLPLNGRHA